MHLVGRRGPAQAKLTPKELRGLGLILSDRGRVTDASAAVPGLHVTGWPKRGPTGIIGTNRAESIETVQCVLEDLAHAPLGTRRGLGGL